MKTNKGGILILCDFDGTVCTVDMGNEVLNRFTDEGWKEIDRAYCANEIGSRVAYTQISSLFSGTKLQMLEFVRERERIDPYFHDFYFFCKEMGFDLKIVSDGLDFYIDAILTKYNLRDIEFFSNVAVFHGNGNLTIEFPRMNDQCEKCGTCKSAILESYRPVYERVVYVGNGYSDICPAGNADLVFAKGVLYDKSIMDGRTCVYFENFKDVHDFIKKNVVI